MSSGPVIFGASGLALSDAEASFFREADPFGFILFARNISTPDQVRRLTGDLREAVGREAPVLIDQEGGRVQRMTPPHWRAFPPPLDVSDALGDAAAEEVRLRYRIIATELLAVGIDVNCAPTLDIARPETHPFLMNRCWGRTPERVADLGRVAAEAHLATGVLPVIKHMPGHGAASQDSHAELPRVSLDRDTLETVDFAPFRALSDLPVGMTGHMRIDVLGEGPTTLSPGSIALIREEIGFQGLLLTDDLSMGALSGHVAERAVAALGAGCDIALHCNGDMAEMVALAADIPAMTARASKAAETALACRKPQDVVQLDELIAEYGGLMEAHPNGGHFRTDD